MGGAASSLAADGAAADLVPQALQFLSVLGVGLIHGGDLALERVDRLLLGIDLCLQSAVLLDQFTHFLRTHGIYLGAQGDRDEESA